MRGALRPCGHRWEGRCGLLHTCSRAAGHIDNARTGGYPSPDRHAEVQPGGVLRASSWPEPACIDHGGGCHHPVTGRLADEDVDRCWICFTVMPRE